jgi:hypothetical protein
MKVYSILGGGQRVRQDVDYNLRTMYRIEECDLPEKNGIWGQDFFTNKMWSYSLDNLQRWANEWAGKKIKLYQEEDDQ